MAVTNVRMQIDQISQDTTNNFSTVRVRGFATMTGQSYNDYTKTGTYYLDGQAYTFRTTLPKGTTKTLFDVQHPVYHNPDGTKTVTGSFSLATGISAGTISASAELTLTTIPRATTCPYSAFRIDTDSDFYINPASSSFSHVLNYFYNGQEYWLATIPIGVSETKITIPATFYSYIPDSSSIELPIKLYTYEGEPYSGTLIGTSESTGNFAISIYNDISPKINGFSVIDINEKTINLTGNPEIIVNNHSTVQATIDAYSPSYANLLKYALGFKIDESTFGLYEGYTSNVVAVPNFAFPQGATPIMLAKVEDSRGKSGTLEKDISDKFINYFNIFLMDETTLGGNYVAFARPQIFSEKMKIGFAGEYWKGNFGTVTNSMSVRYRVKANKGDFCDWQTLQPYKDYLDIPGFEANRQYFATGDLSPSEDGSYRYYPIEIQNPLTEDGTWDYLTTYTFEVEFVDKLTTHAFTRIVYPSNPILSWYEDGEKVNHVEVHGQLETDGSVFAGDAYQFIQNGTHQNTALIGSRSTWKPNALSFADKCLAINCGKNSTDDGEFGIAYYDTRAYPFTDGSFYQNFGEYRCLDTSMYTQLWWNYSHNTFGEGYLGVDVSPYDFIMVITSAGSHIAKVGAGYNAMNFFDVIWDANGGGDRVCKRSCWFGYNEYMNNQLDVYIGACSGWGINGYTGYGNQDATIIPMAVYGIKVW